MSISVVQHTQLSFKPFIIFFINSTARCH